jgi:hypothetical protein
MSDSKGRRDGLKRGANFFLGLMAGVFVYVLSCGPAFFIGINFPEFEPLFKGIYTPLEWLWEDMIQDTPLEKPLKLYCDFWLDLAFK